MKFLKTLILIIVTNLCFAQVNNYASYNWERGQAFNDTVRFADTARFIGTVEFTDSIKGDYLKPSQFVKTSLTGHLQSFNLDSLVYVQEPNGVRIGYYNAPTLGAGSVVIGEYNAESATSVGASVLIGQGIANPATTLLHITALGNNSLNQFEGGETYPIESFGFDNLGSLTQGGFNASFGHDGFYSMSKGYWNAGLGPSSGDGIQEGYQLTILGGKIRGFNGNYRGTTAIGFGARVSRDYQFSIGCDTVPAGTVDTIGGTGFTSWEVTVNGTDREIPVDIIGNTLVDNAIAYNESGKLESAGTYVSATETIQTTNMEVDVAGAFYLGDQTTDGSWRIIISGSNLLIQRRESSAWVTKDTITP